MVAPYSHSFVMFPLFIPQHFSAFQECTTTFFMSVNMTFFKFDDEWTPII